MPATPPQFLAVDLGASHGRAVLGTLDDAVLQVEEVHRFQTPLVEEGKRLLWDLGALDREVDAGLRAALDTASILRSLSVDAWGVDFVPLDANGAPLHNPRSYRDPRTQAVIDETLELVSREAIYETTGIQFMPINTLYQVRADRKMEPELVEQTAQRLFIADYFHYRYAGRAVAEKTVASTSQLLNVRTKDWATDLMDTLGIDPIPWPEIVPPGTRLGPMNCSALPTPNSPLEVIAGCSHDTAAAVAATPMRRSENAAYLSCGTWSLLGTEREEPLLTEAVREAGFTNEAGLDDTIRFLTNLTGLWPLQECVRDWREEGEVSYDELLDAAKEAPPPPAPIDLEEERFRHRGEMESKIRAACREQDLPVPETRGEVTRLILESLADSHRRALEDLESLTEQSIDTLYVVGGGSRNDLLCQATANRCGCPVVAGPAEATALGNLLVQARTMGALPDRSIREVVRASVDLSTYTPTSNST